MAKRWKGWKGLVGGAVIGGALFYLLLGGIGDNLVYFLSPSELLAKGDAAVGTPIRLMGTVVPGSVEWNAEDLELRFRITDGTTTLKVESQGSPPQMFQDGIDVIVEGALGEDGLFSAHTVMVKHSNEYAPPEEGEGAPDRYRSLLREGGGS